MPETDHQEPGLTIPIEGTPLEALNRQLPLPGRIKLWGRLAVGTFSSYVSLAREVRSDGLIYAAKKHDERMRQLSGNVAYHTLEENPDLFQPERLLDDA